MAKFTRFTETIKTKGESRVVSITVKLLVTDCTGNIYFTDIQAQEGDKLTGYTVNTEKMLLRQREGGQIVPPKHFNGIVRSSASVILVNIGELSAGLDIRLTPIQPMGAGTIELSQGEGAHRVRFPSAVNSGDELDLLASSRRCLKNGLPTPKSGFYQYTASGDSKHGVKLQDRKSAKLLYEFSEIMKGGERF